MLPPLRAGIAGLGTVGASVLKLLERQERVLERRTGRTIRVTGVSARQKDRNRGVDLSRAEWHENPVSLAKSAGIDVFVELIGGADGPALEATRAALEAGKPVVTANKAMLARHGLELAALADAKGATLRFEASVAGGIPIVKTLREGLAGNSIDRVYGILNGTCNYILSRMEAEKLSFAECLSEAQKLGYAEADPAFDIGGFDTAHKLAILTSLAFGTAVDADAVAVEGIESITLDDLQAADELGYRIKLLGVAKKTALGIEQRVHPTMVRKSSAIARIMGVTNAVVVNADMVREITLSGPGAGGDATASSVAADLADLARGDLAPGFGCAAAALTVLQRAPLQTHQGGYYIRLALHDRPGAAAAVATRMAEKQISLESIIQRSQPGANPSAPVPVTFITHATHEDAIRRVVEAVVADGHIAAKPQVIRIERE